MRLYFYCILSLRSSFIAIHANEMFLFSIHAQVWHLIENRKRFFLVVFVSSLVVHFLLNLWRKIGMRFGWIGLNSSESICHVEVYMCVMMTAMATIGVGGHSAILNWQAIDCAMCEQNFCSMQKSQLEWLSCGASHCRSCTVIIIISAQIFRKDENHRHPCMLLMSNDDLWYFQMLRCGMQHRHRLGFAHATDSQFAMRDPCWQHTLHLPMTG